MQTTMSAQGKLSQTGKVRRRWPLVLLVVCLCLIGAGLWGWQNRYDLLRHQAEKKLMAYGLPGTFEIKSLDLHRAIIQNINIGTADNRIEVRRLTAHYQWKQALKGRFERIDIDGVKLNLSIDENGHIAGLPQTMAGGGTQINLPEQGLHITNGFINWHAPVGEGETRFDLEMKTRQSWSIKADSRKTKLHWHNQDIDVFYQLVIDSPNPNKASVFGSLEIPELSLQTLSAQNTRLDFNLDLTETGENKTVDITGWAKTKAGAFANDLISAKNTAIDFDSFRASFNLPARRLKAVETDWQMNNTHTHIRDAAKRRQVVQLLLSTDKMENLPIAKNFTKALRGKGNNLLQAFRLDGAGHFMWSGSDTEKSAPGYKLTLSRPFQVSGAAQNLVVTKDSTLVFSRPNQDLSFRGNFDWSGPYALNIRKFFLDATSRDGLKPSEVRQVQARLLSQKSWHGAGGAILAPFDLDLEYSGGTPRTLGLKGDVNYDGPLPGGDVEALSAGGQITLLLAKPDQQKNPRARAKTDFTLDFNPSGPIIMNRFISASGWRAERAEFILPDTNGLIRRRGGHVWLETDLVHPHARIVGPQDQRHLYSRADRIHVKADLSRTPQKWALGFENIRLKSNDFPSPGTRIRAARANMDVMLDKSGQIEFSGLVPEAEVETDNIIAHKMYVRFSGQPDNIVSKYQAASVGFKTGDLPSLPVQGTALLRTGVLTGKAQAALPKTGNTPVLITFRSVDGRGTASVDIDKIAFTKRGLQPQYLIPILRGKLADVSGTASAHFIFTFGGGRTPQGSGFAELTDMNMGTLVGPLEGVNAKLTFSSVFPLKTSGLQTAYISLFDPGFPMKNGVVVFEMGQEGIMIKKAEWPVPNFEHADSPGHIRIAPTLWKFGDVENRVRVLVDKVSLGTVLAGIGKDKLTATGLVSGELPAVIKGVNMRIDNGVLSVKGGGVIRYSSPQTDAMAAGSEQAELAFKALRDFKYKELEAHLDGPLDGPMRLKIVFDGHNEDVLNAQPFRFQLVVNGELANIARNLAGSFSNQKNLERIMKIKSDMKTDSGDPK